MAARVEWNLAALTKWEELTGKSYTDLATLTEDIEAVKITDLANMLVCGLYGAEYPNGDIDAIRQKVLAMKPNEMQDFFSALQQKEEAVQ